MFGELVCALTDRQERPNRLGTLKECDPHPFEWDERTGGRGHVPQNVMDM